MPRLTFAWLSLSLAGCPFVGERRFQDIRDMDGDGAISLRFDGTDCDDENPSVNPAAAEIWYDGIDQNCDGRDDDQDGDGFVLADDCDDTDPRLRPDVTWFIDQDGDGFGGSTAIQSCVAPPNAVLNDDDCNDTNAAISPLADERCDGFDRNCDGDPEAGAVDSIGTFIDDDGDGFGDLPGPDMCTVVAGFASVGGDCDDDDPSARPGALGSIEVCDGYDNDCDGAIDDADPDVDLSTGTVSFEDADGDGFGSPETASFACEPPATRVLVGDDCNDSSPSIHPGAIERCDGIDNDCDLRVDVGATDAILYFVDADGDGHGSNVGVLSCESDVPGVAPLDDDCDDSDAAVHPGAFEICGDGILQDCDATLDDCDADGTPDAQDCRPANPAIHPGAPELCDGLDNDCDGRIDAEDPDAPSIIVDYFLDADGDGFGSTVLVASGQACTAPPGGVTNTADCDDANPLSYPGARERCDALDNDCDGEVDEGQPVNPPTFYRDLDGDGFGVTSQAYSQGCVPPGASWADRGGDCDDADTARNPGIPERCDGGVDNDCDGLADLADPDVQLSVYYFDGDGDGLGDLGIQLTECTPPTGYVANPSDCDDSDATVGEGESDAYRDQDGDGSPNVEVSVRFCGPLPAGFIGFSGTPQELQAIADCNDADARVAPGRDETCDSIDNDCDGLVDDLDTDSLLIGAFTVFQDADGDGLNGTPARQCAVPGPDQLVALDCNDADVTIEGPTSWYRDEDGDGAGDPARRVETCVQPTGYVASATDCNDLESTVQSALSPLLVTAALPLEAALAIACDGQTIHLQNNVSLAGSDLDRGVDVRVVGNGHAILSAGELHVSSGRLTLEDVTVRGPGTGIAIQVSGAAALEAREVYIEQVETGIHVGPSAYADLEALSFDVLTAGVHVEGLVAFDGLEIRAGDVAVEVLGGVAFGRGLSSTDAEEHIRLQLGGTLEAAEVLLDGGSLLGVLEDDTRLTLTRAILRGSQTGFMVGQDGTVELGQAVLYDVDGALVSLGARSIITVLRSTIITGTAPWFGPADGSLILESTILAGRHPSAGVPLTQATHTNSAVHPYLLGPSLTSDFATADEIQEYDASAFFRFGEPGCEGASAAYDLHPLAGGPFALADGTDLIGWTSGPDQPEAAWNDPVGGLARGFRAQFGYDGGATADLDGDSLTALEELQAGTDPTSNDTNAIGLTDASANAAPGECAYAL